MTKRQKARQTEKLVNKIVKGLLGSSVVLGAFAIGASFIHVMGA